MSLTAMDIYQLLPQTNCGDCGTPTCLAFAMQLANKQASLDDCPHASEEAQNELASASQPPIKLVEIGAGEDAVEVGNETVMFRHEETFHHPCGVACRITDDLDDDELDEKIENINGLWFERIGEMIGVELVAVQEVTGDAGRFAQVITRVLEDSRQTPILCSEDPDIIAEAFSANADLADENPLIYAATADNYERMAELASEYEVPLAVKVEGLEELAELTPEIKDLGASDLVLDPGSETPLKAIKDFTQIRRQALNNTFRPLGYPIIAFAESDDPHKAVLDASTYVSKYASVVVVDGDQPWQILPILSLRQSLYIDPRVPPAIEAKVYEVGEEVTEDSPVLMTTNFALTYFTIQSEIEASRVPCYVVVVDTEGQSVLTAYSAENLSAEIANEALREFNLADLVNHRELVIPGYIAVMSGALEAESGWNVTVGPREASGIPSFLREFAQNLG